MSMFETLNRPQMRRDRLRDIATRIAAGTTPIIVIAAALYVAYLLWQIDGAMRQVW